WSASHMPGCADASCCESVCSLDPFCCIAAWSQSCAAQALQLCTTCDDICGAPNANDCCTPSQTPGCSDAACCEAVCAIDPTCCIFGWDIGCANDAAALCTPCGGGGGGSACGNPNAGSCCTAGQFPGCSDAACCEAVCAIDPNCCSVNWDLACAHKAVQVCDPALCDGGGTANCGAPNANDCCSASITPGCSDATCCETICAADPFCCNTRWDFICADAADATCSPSACRGVCGQPDANDCCIASQTPGCANAACCEVVCAVDISCCDIAWDASCAANAAKLCGICGGGVCGAPNANDCCMVSLTPGCADAACCEQVCAVDQFCCNSSWDFACASQALQLCTTCDDLCGAPNGNDCCAPSQTPGCSDAACCEQICAVDPSCCIWAWDEDCANAARRLCEPCVPPACTADVTGDGAVNGNDLAALLVAWGSNGQGQVDTDLNNDGIVDGSDLAAVLVAWGSTCQPLPWATGLEFFPSPAVVTDAALRNAITATGYPWRVRDNVTNIEMLLVPPGSFEMGCTESNPFECPTAELPRRQVTITKAFYLGRHEVTQAEWTAIMGTNPSAFQGPSYPDAANHPVDSVFRTEARAFTCTTGLRLPTEAEWEYAYRAGTTTEYHSMPGFPEGTNSPELIESIAWFGAGYGQSGDGNSGGQTHPVGLKAANALGLHDMSGNVEEWVFDRTGSYGAAAEIDPTGPADGSFQLSRGGSWYSARSEVRGASRAFFSWDFSGYGLRVARDIVSQPFTITEVAPPQGSTLGGTQVTLTGHGFDCVQTDLVIVGVNSSGALATEVNAVNDRTMTLVMPARPAGLGTIYLYNPFRQLYAYGSYTYALPAPVITSISPLIGPVDGGTQIIVKGTNLDGTTLVTVGGLAATGVTVINSTTVTAVTPPGAAGLATVGVTTGGGTATLPNAFGYYLPGQWQTVLEMAPDPAVVTNADLRAAIVATSLPWRVRDNLTQIEMVLIPAGSFVMGGSSSDDYAATASELPAHPVTITNSFYMSRYEVTQSQWTPIMGSNPSFFSGFADSPVRPVEGMSWFAARGFATASSMRLPTEAEWEYACRAGTTTAFHSMPTYPNGFNADGLVWQIAWLSSNSANQTNAVGLKPANGFGLHDMSGNVREWVNDWYSGTYYASSPEINPQGPASGDFGWRVKRGGGWLSFSRWLRSAGRQGDPAQNGADDTGVRVVRDP
ncbi:MAG: SUMF1/EgtB/PvdO family nonheme iron enzyme, partial [bacterium]